MKCEVIRDLIPLYIDDCCSQESRSIVEAHLKTCGDCQKVLEDMRSLSAEAAPPADIPVKKPSRVNEWRASVMQSVMLFFSFLLLTVGVTLEAYTPSGERNGMWALAFIIPSAGLLLSLANWYFVRLYKSRRVFSVCSMLVTLAIILCGYLWAFIHFDLGASLPSAPPVYYAMIGLGAILSVIFCVLSKVLSAKFAALSGKV